MSYKIDWTTINNRAQQFGYLRYIGQVTKSSNFNTLGDGIYMYNGWTGSGGTATPPQAMGILIQLGTNATWGTSKAQYLIGNGSIYTRTLASDTWNGWYKYTGTAV